MAAKGNKKILVVRFSALGDVAMTIPVIWSIRQQNPLIEITFVSREFARPLIEKIPGVNFFSADFKGRHKGIIGIFKLYSDLKKAGTPDSFADLHDVLRTRILKFLFRLSGCKTLHIDKGRRDKKLLTRKKYKLLIPLKTTVERYADVFSGLGLNTKVELKSIFSFPAVLPESILGITGIKEGRWIGIAPFAKHKGKSYPIDKMKEVISLLAKKSDFKILLFGGGKAEENALEQFSKEFTSTVNLAGKLKLSQELDIISNLDLMISMDSANMHLASLAGIPVVSIWGATHPYAGFYGWNQIEQNAVQVDLYCRPCSVFGQKPCYRKDLACMNLLEPKMVIQRVLQVLEK